MTFARSIWSVQDAKSGFSAMVRAARREPQIVTRQGRPVVVVVDAAEYERLRQKRRANAPCFVEALMAMPQDDGEFSRARVRPRRF